MQSKSNYQKILKAQAQKVNFRIKIDKSFFLDLISETWIAHAWQKIVLHQDVD